MEIILKNLSLNDVQAQSDSHEPMSAITTAPADESGVQERQPSSVTRLVRSDGHSHHVFSAEDVEGGQPRMMLRLPKLEKIAVLEPWIQPTRAKLSPAELDREWLGELILGADPCGVASYLNKVASTDWPLYRSAGRSLIVDLMQRSDGRMRATDRLVTLSGIRSAVKQYAPGGDAVSCNVLTAIIMQVLRRWVPVTIDEDYAAYRNAPSLFANLDELVRAVDSQRLGQLLSGVTLVDKTLDAAMPGQGKASIYGPVADVAIRATIRAYARQISMYVPVSTVLQGLPALVPLALDGTTADPLALEYRASGLMDVLRTGLTVEPLRSWLLYGMRREAHRDINEQEVTGGPVRPLPFVQPHVAAGFATPAAFLQEAEAILRALTSNVPNMLFVTPAQLLGTLSLHVPRRHGDCSPTQFRLQRDLPKKRGALHFYDRRLLADGVYIVNDEGLSPVLGSVAARVDGAIDPDWASAWSAEYFIRGALATAGKEDKLSGEFIHGLSDLDAEQLTAFAAEAVTEVYLAIERVDSAPTMLDTPELMACVTRMVWGARTYRVEHQLGTCFHATTLRPDIWVTDPVLALVATKLWTRRGTAPLARQNLLPRTGTSLLGTLVRCQDETGVTDRLGDAYMPILGEVMGWTDALPQSLRCDTEVLHMVREFADPGLLLSHLEAIRRSRIGMAQLDRDAADSLAVSVVVSSSRLREPEIAALVRRYARRANSIQAAVTAVATRLVGDAAIATAAGSGLGAAGVAHVAGVLRAILGAQVATNAELYHAMQHALTTDGIAAAGFTTSAL